MDEPTTNHAALGANGARSTGSLASGLTTSEFTQIAPNHSEEEKVLKRHLGVVFIGVASVANPRKTDSPDKQAVMDHGTYPRDKVVTSE